MPAWAQAMRTYAVSADGRHLAAIRSVQAVHQIERIELATGRARLVPCLAPYTEISQIVASPTGDRIAMLASAAATPPRIVVHDFAQGQTRIVARASHEAVPSDALSNCEPISWPTADGETAYGLYYPPASDRFTGSGRPPLIVIVHGGPTSQVKAGWSPQAQFFATRGYAVLLVNYRGSTGYGRSYMLRLRGNWGVCDVEDSVSGAQYLADSGTVDPDRTVIMGGSAGGFTVLQTMIDQPEVFAAGICLYGVANQFHLAQDTHKFEARYLDSLLGPLPQSAQRLSRAISPLPRRPHPSAAGDLPRGDRPRGSAPAVRRDRRDPQTQQHSPPLPRLRRRGPRLAETRDDRALLPDGRELPATVRRLRVTQWPPAARRGRVCSRSSVAVVSEEPDADSGQPFPPSSAAARRRHPLALRIGLSTLGAISLIAIAGYRIAGWSWLDSVYMVATTLTTVGYREMGEMTPALKGFTILVIVFGVSTTLYTMGGFVQMVLEGEVNRALGLRRVTKEIERLSGHTILCGFGRMGEVVAAELARRRQPFVVVDQDQDRITEATALGYLAIAADSTEEETLLQLGVQKAKSLVITLPGDADNVFITLTARNLNADLKIIVRGELRTTEKKLIQAGADRVVLPAATGAPAHGSHAHPPLHRRIDRIGDRRNVRRNGPR